MVAVERVDPSPAAAGTRPLSPWRLAQGDGPTLLQVVVLLCVNAETTWLALVRVLPGEAASAIFVGSLAYAFRDVRRRSSRNGGDEEPV